MSSQTTNTYINDEDFFNFPKSFQFFSRIISYSSVFVSFSSFILFFSLIQQFFTVFSPIFILPTLNSQFFSLNKSSYEANNSESELSSQSFFTKMTLSILQYDPNGSQFSTYDPKSLFYFAPCGFIISITIFFYILFRNNHRIPSILCQTRFLLFLCTPSMAVLPIALQVAISIKSFIYNEDGNQICMIQEIISGLIFLIILFIFIFWASSLVLYSPYLGDGHIPSHMIPDMTFFKKTQLLDIINSCLCIIGNCDFSIIFFVVIGFFNGIYKICIVLRYPFVSLFHSSIICSFSFAYSIGCLLVFHYLFLSIFNILIIIAISVALIIVSSFFFFYLFSHNEKRQYNILTSEDYSQINKKLIYQYMQLAISKEIVSESFIEYLNTNFRNEQSPEFLMLRIICDLPNIQKYSNALYVLLHNDNLMFAQKFLVYRLYLVYMSKRQSSFHMKRLDKVEEHLKRYMKYNDDFWSLMLRGKTNEALSNVHYISSKMTNLLQDYSMYQDICPHNPRINALNQDFFYHFGTITEESRAMLISASQSQNSTAMSSDTTSQFLQISLSMRRVLEDHIPISLILLKLLSFVFFILFLYSSMFPVFHLGSQSSFLVDLSPVVNSSLNIALEYSNINYVLSNAVGCTDLFNMTCETIFTTFNSTGLSPTNDCKNLRQFYENLVDHADNLLEYLNSITRMIHILAINHQNAGFVNSWSDQCILMFPFSKNSTISHIKVDIISVMLQIASKIKSNYNIDLNDTCASTFLDSIRPELHDMSNRSIEVQLQINNSLQQYYDYLTILQDTRAVFFNKMDLIIFIVFGCLSLLINPIFTILNEIRFYKMLNKYFRPKVHPNPEIKIERTDTVDRFTPSVKFISTFMIWVVIYLIAFILCVTFSKILSPLYNEIMTESKILIGIERLALYVILTIETLQNNQQFKNDTYVHNMYFQLQRDLLHSMNEFYGLISPENTAYYQNNPMTAAMSNECEISGLSSHDLYNCWCFFHKIEMFFFIIDTHGIDEFPPWLLPQISHIYITHMNDDFISITDSFSRYVLTIREHFLSFIVFGKIVFFVSIFLVFGVVVYDVCYILHIQRQISRYFLTLSPVFVAENECLMNYASDENEKKKKEKNIVKADSYMALYDKADIALILLNDHLTITNFTVPTQKYFSYRSEQLIGQQIDLIFPPDFENNDARFYQHISIVKRKQAESSFTRTLIGRLSDGERNPFKVKITMFEEDNSMYFVLECKSLYDLYAYDEWIYSHTEIFNEIYQTAMPSALSSNEGEIVTQTYKRFCLVYVAIPMENNDFEMSKLQIQMTLPYFDGKLGSIVFYMTDASCLILFLDAHPNYLDNSFEFFKSYGAKSCGFIIESTDIAVTFFPPPQVPEEYRSQGMPIEAIKKLPQSMTIEPMADVLNKIPSFIGLCKAKKLICTSGILQFFVDSPHKIVNNGMNMELFSIDL